MTDKNAIDMLMNDPEFIKVITAKLQGNTPEAIKKTEIDLKLLTEAIGEELARRRSEDAGRRAEIEAAAVKVASALGRREADADKAAKNALNAYLNP